MPNKLLVCVALITKYSTDIHVIDCTTLDKAKKLDNNTNLISIFKEAALWYCNLL